jgi:predicted RNase H-like HicB family nuclease
MLAGAEPVREAERHQPDAKQAFDCSNALLGGARGATLTKRSTMALALTAVFKKVPEGYIAFVEELPGANTQGATLDEARENLREAVQMVLDANRELAREEAGDDVIREPFSIADP